MMKKIREFLSQKGQGTVEYALILGFAAITAVYMLTGSGLTKNVEQNIKNAATVAADINTAYGNAKNPTGNAGNGSGTDNSGD